MDPTIQEPPWKRIKLSLERPYKDDHGEHMLNVLDITQDGEYILEPRENMSQKLGHDFSRIFAERGPDFFEKVKSGRFSDDAGSSSGQSDQADDSSNLIEDEKRAAEHLMTHEELLQMRLEMLPQLHVALGEMSHARDLLSALLSSGGPGEEDSIPGLPKGALATATMSKPVEIPSVRAFNSQLILGGKDAALRKAAAAFKSAANSIERVRTRGEKYWSDALTTRNSNWGLVPAPLPPGASTGKGADKTAQDFWITFGLTESPIGFKRRAMAHLSVYDSEENPLVFPRHQATRMRISLVHTEANGLQRASHNTHHPEDDKSIDYCLRSARNEVIDQEIFSKLIKEAALLPTAAVNVSERLIIIEAAQGSELHFELVEEISDSESPFAPQADSNDTAICDLIHSSLVLLLLRAHTFARKQRLSTLSSRTFDKQRSPTALPPLLLPVYNMLQYKLFCERVERETRAMEQALKQASVPSMVRFDAVGETGTQLVDHLRGEDRSRIGGDAVLRVDNRHTLRFTFMAPSNLVAHLPHATLVIASVPQLSQLLKDEVERCLLDSICRIGKSGSASVGGIWFVDKLSTKCVGRWDTTLLTFKLSFADGDHPDISCEAVEVKDSLDRPIISVYGANTAYKFLDWIGDVVNSACDTRGT